MARAKTTVVWDERNFQALVDGPIKADNVSRARKVRRAIRAVTPKGETRALERSIDILDTTGVRGGIWVSRVGSDLAYAGFVNNGTGIYGPRGDVIQPRHAAFLAWSEDGRQIKARQVRGQPGQHFFERGLEAGFR